MSTLVVNPAAGRGRAGRILPRVLGGLAEHHVAVDHVVEARDYAHARSACSDAVGSGQPLLVLGGDGMAHLGLNACAGTGVPLGVIPAGTGNDFCRGVGLPARWTDAVRIIAAGHTRRLDLMEVTGDTLAPHPTRPGLEYVGSVVSTGFDELVNERTNRLPFTIGALSYAWSVLAELAAFRPLRYRIELDGEVRALDAILVAVGNAGVVGGGIRLCPDADVTDGLLDVTIVHPVGRGTLVRLLPTLFTGGFRTHPAVELVRARVVRIDGDGLRAMADGEPLGEPPLTCRAASGALTLYAPA